MRKLALTTHVSSSVGWVGAVAAFLALAIAGLTRQDPQLVRAAYVSMELTTWAVIVPLSLAALITGLVQSLGTPWGVLRHHWIVAKLVLTVLATIVLLIHTAPIGRAAAAATASTLSATDLRPLRMQLVADAGAALVALLIATALSVFKPWGLTSYGRAMSHGAMAADRDQAPGTWWVWFWLLGLMGAITLFSVLHFARCGGGSHL